MDEDEEPKYDNIHVETEVMAKSDQVYQAWLDSETHTKMLKGCMRGPVVISNIVGGTFQVGDGDDPRVHTGVIVELVPNRRIVEVWRHREFAQGEYTILTLSFEARGENTKIILDQKGIPHEFGGMRLERGWTQVYLTSVAKYFADGRL